MALRSIPLPTLGEIRRELPNLLAASGELVGQLHGPDGQPHGPPHEFHVVTSLSPAYANTDFDPDLTGFDGLERAFIERQIERTHRDHQLGPVLQCRWTLTELTTAQLTDWSIQDGDEPFGVLALEVPVFTTDRSRAVLRGQRCESAWAEDFEHHLTRVEGVWTRQ